MCSNQRQLQARFCGPYYQPESAQYPYFDPFRGVISKPQPNCTYRGRRPTKVVVVQLPCPPPPPSCARPAKPQVRPAPTPCSQSRRVTDPFKQGPSTMMSTVHGGTGKVETMPDPSPGKDANSPLSEPEDDDGSDGGSDDSDDDK